MPNLMEQTILL